jgi:hypothetical protein
MKPPRSLSVAAPQGGACCGPASAGSTQDLGRRVLPPLERRATPWRAEMKPPRSFRSLSLKGVLAADRLQPDPRKTLAGDRLHASRVPPGCRADNDRRRPA